MRVFFDDRKVERGVDDKNDGWIWGGCRRELGELKLWNRRKTLWIEK